MTKEAGGLGFRDLRKFNIAMLAKQGWRLMNNDNQLVTSLMKARYYPNCDFLDAKIGDNPSFMWRSILAAQESVRKGCRKRIGNGKDTFVWKVPWLPSTENGMLTTTMPQELENITVQGLMEVNTRAWDREVIHDIVNNRDEELILKIPLPVGDRNDTWFWCLETEGNFTVRSVYRMLQGEHALPHKRFWNKVWSLKLPGKVTNFLWRVSRSWLPTAAALAEKRVQIDTCCQWCLQAVESAVHVLFECSFAKSVWTDERVQMDIQVVPGDTVFNVLSRIFDRCNKEQIVQVVMMCWSIWNRRNKWVWDRVNMSSFGVQAHARNLLYDWRRMLQDKQKNNIVVQASTRTWSPPPPGYVKVNIDAAVFTETKHMGVGAVIRDEHGCFLRARGRQFPADFLPKEAEALSLQEALSWALQAGYTKCVFETDAKLLVDACSGNKGRSYFHSIVNECVDLFKHFCNVLVRFAHRSANEVAHVLARATHFMSDTQEWVDTAPEFLLDALSFDAI